jgi:hypothetical protein
MVGFNELIFEDIEKTVREIWTDIQHGRLHFDAHQYVTKVTEEIALKEISAEYVGAPPSAQQALKLAKAGYKAARTIHYKLWPQLPSYAVFRLYLNINPFYVGHFMRAAAEIVNPTNCPYCHSKLAYPGPDVACPYCHVMRSYCEGAICEHCLKRLPTFKAFCYTCKKFVQGVIGTKFVYLMQPWSLVHPGHDYTELQYLQEMLRANKLVLYLDRDVPALHRVIDQLRALSPEFFGKGVPRFTKPVAKGIGFGAEPPEDINKKYGFTSIGLCYAKVCDHIYYVLETEAKKGKKILSVQDIKRISREAYKEVEAYAAMIHEPF